MERYAIGDQLDSRDLGILPFHRGDDHPLLFRSPHSFNSVDHAINYANYTNEEESRSKSNREINIARRTKISFRGILI